MNNIRKIIEERLENARLDYGNTTREPQLELKGQIEAYQDCLNLIPAPRTEQEILKDFEKLIQKNKKLKEAVSMLCLVAKLYDFEVYNNLDEKDRNLLEEVLSYDSYK